MRQALARTSLPPLAVNFLGYAHDHTELEIPDADALEFFQVATNYEGLRAAITRYYGPRCGEDASSYLYTPEQGICGCCEAWLAFDRFTCSVVYPAAVIEGL